MMLDTTIIVPVICAVLWLVLYFSPSYFCGRYDGKRAYGKTNQYVGLKAWLYNHGYDAARNRAVRLRDRWYARVQRNKQRYGQ